jgi:hypothetical protein
LRCGQHAIDGGPKRSGCGVNTVSIGLCLVENRLDFLARLARLACGLGFIARGLHGVEVSLVRSLEC